MKYLRGVERYWSALSVAAVLVAILIAAPVLSVFSNVFAGGTSATWAHLVDTVLGEFVLNTVVLCIGVGLGVSSIGVTAGASAPEVLVHDVILRLQEMGVSRVRELEGIEEKVTFPLPRNMHG